MLLSCVLWLCLLMIQHATAMTDDDKKAIVQLHNELRAKTAKGETKDKNGVVQPGAADMNKLTWDDDVAKAAETWVNTCPKPGPHGHDVQSTYGENIAWGAPPEQYPMTKLTQLWYDEIDKKPGELFGKVSAFNFEMVSKGVGHYTQMMYSKSYLIGCADKICDGKITLVCRYLLAGNIEGEPIYNEGAACSKCHKAQTCDGSLCAGPPFDCTADDPPHCAAWGTSPGCSDGTVMGDCPKMCKLCK